MAIKQLNLSSKPLPKGKKTFDFSKGDSELKKWRKYVLDHDGEVRDMGKGLFQAYLSKILCGWWNPNTKSAFVNFDTAFKSTPDRPY